MMNGILIGQRKNGFLIAWTRHMYLQISVLTISEISQRYIYFFLPMSFLASSILHS
jgi:hypothetical protein